MEHTPPERRFDGLQKTAMSLMVVLTLITFVGANLHAMLWQSSDWLVSTVLPATVVDLTNKERSQETLAPLQRNATLDAAATLKAQDMAKNEYFAHYSPAGVSPWHWFDEAGYVYAHAGENLAIHFTDSAEVVDAWMDSPTHKENIVNGRYTEIGVGTAKGSYQGYDTVYVVQLFGTPAVRTAAAVTKPAAESVVAIDQDTQVVLVEAVPDATVATTASSSVLASSKDKPVVSRPVEVAIAPAPAPVELVVEEATSPQVVAVPPSAPVPVTPDPVAQEVVEVTSETPLPANTDVLTATELPASEIVIVRSPLISTSSGLAVVNITTQNPNHAGATLSSIATQPNELLQLVYTLLGLVVLGLLCASAVVEARRMHYVQVSYSIGLLLLMGGLWFVHSMLTVGAVIV